MEEKDDNMLKYSVLMSVYAKDNPEYLKVSIESMLNQTVKPEQFVIVLDGPIPRKIADIIEQYGQNEQLFTIVPLKVNFGLGKALDVGMKYCRNELIARMDADDISLPERCEKQLNLFSQNNTLVICGTNIDEFFSNPEYIETIRKVPSTYNEIVKFIRRRQPFNHPTVMYKKSEIIRCGGYGNLRRKQDLDLFSRMINMGCYALNIDESLLKFRADEDNYKRRKSWSYVKSTIAVARLNYQRGYCSIIDFMYILVGQIVLFLLPIKIMKLVSDRLLRAKMR